MENWTEIVDGLGGLVSADGGPPQPVSEVDMLKVEDKLGFCIPSELRSFLKEYGTCSFLVTVKFPPASGLAHQPNRVVASFFAVENPDGSGASLLKGAKIDRGRLPEELLGFAVGWSENYEICIGVSGEYEGRVYFWDLALEPELDDFPDPVERKKARWSVIHELAPSFRSFMESLEATED